MTETEKAALQALLLLVIDLAELALEADESIRRPGLRRRLSENLGHAKQVFTELAR